MDNSIDFEEPSSLEEAEARRDELVIAIQSIQTQLGSRNRTDTNGRRLSFKEYAEWRTRATHSHTIKSAELRFVNRWIKRARKDAYEKRNDQFNLQGALTHVRRMHTMILQLRDDGVELTAEEEKQVREAETFLRLYGTKEDSNAT